MEKQNDLIITRAIEKAKEVHHGLCAAMAELEATGKITKDTEACRRVRDARSGMDILLRILRGEINMAPPFGLQEPQK